MAGVFQAIPGTEAPVMDTPVFAPPSNQASMGAIPFNVACIVLLSTGVLIAFDLLRIQFAIGVG